MNKSVSITEGLHIIIARLVLEVFGGGGAIWGFSEVLTLRNPETVELWRSIAQIGACVFFLRYLLQIFDMIRSKDVSKERTPLRFIATFVPKLVLEVFGAGGAIWGFSEVATVRYSETIPFWRTWALIVATVFLFRYMCQARDFIREIRGLPTTSLEGMDPWLRFYQIFLAKLVLEVFGGAGAIWGFSEIMTWRNPETQGFWRLNALIACACFYIRFLVEMKEYVIDVIYADKERGVACQPFVCIAKKFCGEVSSSQ
mmetsp:Transcript_30213/g.46263  ORF Transcript_30213/g.46263 Transcript_30213/m.46263 type:complete len:257 (-) Transcript_30213:55-825(-)